MKYSHLVTIKTQLGSVFMSRFETEKVIPTLTEWNTYIQSLIDSYKLSEKGWVVLNTITCKNT